MNKLSYVNSLEYHKAMKMNELELHTWTNLKNIMLNKESKLPKNTSSDFIYKNFKNIEGKQCII